MPTPCVSTYPRSRTIPLALILAAWLCLGAPPGAHAQVSSSLSFFVPQSGAVATPSEGTLATRFFRVCPNNDGGSSLPSSARIKVVLRDSDGLPIAGVAAADVCILLNGGTAAQGYAGIGADSVIANSTYNPDPLCPDVTCIAADAATDVSGVTYITFTGAAAGSPGVGVRDATRKWGHYDSELPVYALGTHLQGRLTSASANGTYVLQIKNFDVVDGLDLDLNAGEAVTIADKQSFAYGVNLSTPVSFWLDLDSSGSVTATDFNIMLSHFNHDCDTPNNP